MKCSLCGHIGTEIEKVVTRPVWIPNKGIVEQIECENRVRCWARNDGVMAQMCVSCKNDDCSYANDSTNKCVDCFNGSNYKPRE